MTAFAASDGTRRWTVPLADRARVSALATSAERVLVQASDALFVRGASNGKAIATLGSLD